MQSWLILIVFCGTDFDMMFPLSSAKALPRQPSDHTPILWESGVGQKIDNPRFKFEKWWLKNKEFEKLVKYV
jgi:hypothetical protein